MDRLIILGHDTPDVDSIISGYILEKILKIKGYNVKFVIPDEKINEDTLQICTRNGLDPLKFMQNINLEDKNAKYILVDHNERNLGGQIVCIIDHHPTNKEIKCANYYNTQISSTACLICRENEDVLDELDLKLAVLATLVDTASFHSTKGRKEDEEWVLNLCNKYNFNYDELSKEGLGVSNLDDINTASLNGLKKHDLGGKKVESSYVQIDEPLLMENKIQKIIQLLKERVKELKLDAFVFIVHDIKEFKTMYYLITESKTKKNYYDVYTQRGNTIIPEVEKILKNN